MWEKFRAIFTIPELRQKIFFTLILLAVFRVGYQIPLPFVDQVEMAKRTAQQSDSPLGNLLAKVAVFSASDLRQMTILGLGIMPYISASIILQLLGSVYKPLEELRKEGETGRKKINEYTRYLTIAICIIQSIFYLQSMVRQGTSNSVPIFDSFMVSTGAGAHLAPAWFFTSLLIMTCGTMFVMWIGEQIDEFGIGNGISLLIMAGILAQMPLAMRRFFSTMKWQLVGSDASGQVGVDHLVILMFLFVIVVMGVCFITLGQRQIPTQSAKHVRGRRVYGGSRQYLPLKLNQSGVMPIIFASSMLMLPAFLLQFLASSLDSAAPGFAGSIKYLGDALSSGTSFIYNLLYVALIYFFSYFWMAITFNPKEMAENLKDFGTFIPGYRPGRRTAEHLEKVMVRITYVGAAFLSLVAIVPTIISSSLGVDAGIASFYGGTGLLIAVSVAFDLIQKIDSHLVMRDYRGLLEA
ncbi:Protein translocase subunit SecY [Anatilimnocola aggregata]|uniref:Protein translocase subunit SecY n=1 Tax=Anatilimnocola aggregata TaxID=2528021 RepID=A0A517YJQ9_9BACT|nr:preprotein translocase subunit SecY [Anatilimnocola aggregata]QDU30458.1 Protein translocase subunit SecY [Anatilimnocola aggregata]